MDKNLPFYFKDCALVAIATGIRAQTLIEFRDKLAVIHPGCIFYHFWSSRLGSSIESDGFNNEFAKWAHEELHDDFLAERLELVNPSEHEDIELLRADLIEIVEHRLDEVDSIPFAKRDKQFQFIRSSIVIFDTSYQIAHPNELASLIPILSRSSIFYHFIDSKRRSLKGKDDFSTWLEGFQGVYTGLIAQLDAIDPYFISLAELQQKLIAIVNGYFLGKD